MGKGDYRPKSAKTIWPWRDFLSEDELKAVEAGEDLRRRSQDLASAHKLIRDRCNQRARKLGSKSCWRRFLTAEEIKEITAIDEASVRWRKLCAARNTIVSRGIQRARRAAFVKGPPAETWTG